MTNQSKVLYRLPGQGKIAGVCAGLAEYFEFDVTLLRVIWFVAVFFTGGFALLVYIVLAIILPVKGGKRVHNTTGHHDEFSERVVQLGHDIEESHGVSTARNYFGLSLIIFGVWLLLAQFVPDWVQIRWDYIWPMILIVLGLSVVARRR